MPSLFSPHLTASFPPPFFSPLSFPKVHFLLPQCEITAQEVLVPLKHHNESGTGLLIFSHVLFQSEKLVVDVCHTDVK